MTHSVAIPPGSALRSPANQLAWQVPGGQNQVCPPLTPKAIFDEHAPRVYRLARRLLGNADDAEDVTQDVFLQVVRKLPTYRGDAAISTWLYRIAFNAALARRQERALRKVIPFPEPLDDFREDRKHGMPIRRWMRSPSDQALDREAHEIIEQAIAGLPEIYRDVFVLAGVEELPNSEIAETLGLSIAAVKSRLHRARLLLHKTLSPYFEERAARSPSQRTLVPITTTLSAGRGAVNRQQECPRTRSPWR